MITKLDEAMQKVGYHHVCEGGGFAANSVSLNEVRLMRELVKIEIVKALEAKFKNIAPGAIAQSHGKAMYNQGILDAIKTVSEVE